MKVVNAERLKEPKWKRVLTCTCKNDLDKCLHCNYTQREESIPAKDFEISWTDENDNIIRSMITTVELVFGKHEEVIGWRF